MNENKPYIDFEEILERIDKQRYKSKAEHNACLEIIKVCFKENEHLKEYIDVLEKDYEILEILKPYLKQTLEITEYAGGIELRFKPIAFGFGLIHNTTL